MKKLVVGLVVAVLAAVLFSANTTTEAVPTSVIYKGLQHTPLGAATLSIIGDTLVVGNIGSSGEDGVLIDVGKVARWDSRIGSLGDPGDPANPIPDGAFYKVTSRGTIGGGPNQVITVARYEDIGSRVKGTLDFSATGTASLVATFFSGSNQVHTETINSDIAILSWPGDWPVTNGISVIPCALSGHATLIDWCADIWVDYPSNVPIATPGGFNISADAVQVLTVDPTALVSYSTVALTAAHIPSIAIMDESFSFLPVGGIVELRGDADTPADVSGSSSARDYTAPVVAAVAVGAIALAASGWCVRRRLS